MRLKSTVLSSITAIRGRVACVSTRLLVISKAEPERRARARPGGFHPDAPVMLLDNLLADCQSNTRAWVLAAVKAVENAKNLIVVFGRNADTVILHRDDPLSVLLLRADFDVWRVTGAVLDCVADQILKHLNQLHLVPVDRRKPANMNDRCAIQDRRLQVAHC